MTSSPVVPIADRDVQLSLLGDRDRPVGRQLGSIVTGTNADLVAAVAPLYLAGDVCDVTYGRGGWWTRCRPAGLVAHDLIVDGVDFRHLPEPDGTFDAVTFDPPYVVQGGDRSATRLSADFRDRYGLAAGGTRAGLLDLHRAGTVEAVRVLRPGGYLLTKRVDAVAGDVMHAGIADALEAAVGLPVDLVDVIVHNYGDRPLGPGGHNTTRQRRTRRHHSYLVVFRRRRG